MLGNEEKCFRIKEGVVTAPNVECNPYIAICTAAAADVSISFNGDTKHREENCIPGKNQVRSMHCAYYKHPHKAQMATGGKENRRRCK